MESSWTYHSLAKLLLEHEGHGDTSTSKNGSPIGYFREELEEERRGYVEGKIANQVDIRQVNRVPGARKLGLFDVLAHRKGQCVRMKKLHLDAQWLNCF